MAAKVLIPAFTRKPDGRSVESRVSRRGKRVGEPLTWDDYLEQLAQAQVTPTPVPVTSWAWDERLGRGVPVPQITPWAPSPQTPMPTLPAPRVGEPRLPPAAMEGVAPVLTGAARLGLGAVRGLRQSELGQRIPGFRQAPTGAASIPEAVGRAIPTFAGIMPAGWTPSSTAEAALLMAPFAAPLAGLPLAVERAATGMAAQAARRGAGMAVGQVAPRAGLKLLSVPEVAGGMVPKARAAAVRRDILTEAGTILRKDTPIEARIAELKELRSQLEAQINAKTELQKGLTMSARRKKALRSQTGVGLTGPELNVQWKNLDDLIAEVEAMTPEQMAALGPKAPPPQVGAMQAGMGIGERPAQGEIFAEFGGAGTAGAKPPLIEAAPLQAAAERRAALARGQREMMASAAKPPAPVAPEAARAAEPPIPPAAARAAAPPPVEAPVLPGKAAAPPPVEPPTARAILRLSIRSTQREGGGFLITGRDTKNRQVRVFAKTLGEAKQARDNLRQGLEPFAGTETEAQARALNKAERKYRAALKRGEPGAVERARTELEQIQARQTAGAPPMEPPKLPSKMMPNGTEVPPPEFEAVRNKLVSLLRGAARKGAKEIEQARAAERARRFAVSRAATERALAEGRSPLSGIRAAQRGEMPVAELALPDRLTPEEVAVLRDRIYKTLGPELDWTSANIEESLTRLATEGKIPTGAEMAWMEELFGPELIEALRALRTRGAKITEVMLEAWNLPRAVLASFDDSMVLRQGLHLLPEGTPAARALKAHIRALTKVGADGVNATIRANPWFNHGRAHGLDLTLPGMGRGIGGREEVYMGAGLARRIPILGKGVEISERIATGYLNKLRIETYAAHAEELSRMEAGYAAFKELAENINILSGRASLGRLQPIAPYVNGMFFSARLNWAAAQRPFRILRQVTQLGTPEGRHLAKMLARDVYGVWAAIGGMLGLGAAAGVIAVELDSRSSDFGKARIGTARLDPWGGSQQLAVLVTRIISGQTTATTTGGVRPADPVQVLARFLESKMHPALSQLIAIRRGETYVGEDLTVKEYAKMWAPLFIQDILEIAGSTSPGVAMPLGLAGFFGVSVYNIPTQSTGPAPSFAPSGSRNPFGATGKLTPRFPAARTAPWSAR